MRYFLHIITRTHLYCLVYCPNWARWRAATSLAIFDEKPQTCQPRYRYAVLLRTTVPELKQFTYCAMGLSNELVVLRSTDFFNRNSTGNKKTRCQRWFPEISLRQLKKTNKIAFSINFPSLSSTLFPSVDRTFIFGWPCSWVVTKKINFLTSR